MVTFYIIRNRSYSFQSPSISAVSSFLKVFLSSILFFKDFFMVSAQGNIIITLQVFHFNLFFSLTSSKMYYLRTWVKDKVKNGDQPSKPKSYKEPNTWSNRIPTTETHKKKPVTQTKGAKRQLCVLIPIYIKLDILSIPKQW